MTCIKCEHWDSDREGHGICEKAEFYDGYGDLDKSLSMYVTDGSGYAAGLYTRHDHSCIQFKERK